MMGEWPFVQYLPGHLPSPWNGSEGAGALSRAMQADLVFW